MHYHTESDEDVYDQSIFAKMDPDDEDHSTLTSQTLNADGTPKRPMNAFMIFARRRRPQVSAENQSMRTGDISKILSQEWKAMLPADKQFYLTQAKQLKESFNKKYPEYVYRRRPNNSRKRRKPDAAGTGAPSPATDEAESSPDGEEPPPLPDAHRYAASPYDRYVSSGSPYAASSSAYGSSAYSYGGGHVRTQSYPYPPTNAGEYRYDARTDGASGGLLGTAYYPPYDANHPLPSSSSSSHSVNGAGLRKAHSIPSMPTTSAPQSWAPSSTPTSHSSQHSHSHSHSSASSSASHPSSSSHSSHSNGTPTASSTAYYTHHSHPASYSPPLSTRYSPYATSASSASPASNSYSGSPAPVYSSPYTAATASPPSAHANSNYNGGGGGGAGGTQSGGGGYPTDSPRALAAHLGGLTASSNIGGGGGSALGLSGHGLGGLGIAGHGHGGAGLGVGGEYYWRADKLL
ncbi:hypothetical protein C8R47DRAFT_566281 [Mycena vitilis]|nr:hypothetical protein C8R47DRAFT_566281 [Mycena vitilis]